MKALQHLLDKQNELHIEVGQCSRDQISKFDDKELKYWIDRFCKVLIAEAVEVQMEVGLKWER